MAEAARNGLGASAPHDSARRHVTGEAVYVDDMAVPANCLHIALGLSRIAAGRIVELDLAAVWASPGVVLVVTAKDVPGVNDISPTHRHDEPIFSAGEIAYWGQPIFAVAAESREAARLAARAARIAYEPRAPVLTMAEARAAGDLVTEPLTLARGRADRAIEDAPHRLRGRMGVGGQEHFYLEGHVALALPGEEDEITVHSSTQHPSEVQAMIAQALGLARHAVTVEVRRMGGAFGGKETQGAFFAVAAALVARKTGRAAKLRPDRDDDMIATGKRHDFEIDYECGFDHEGRIAGVDMVYAARCGWSADLSGPVTDRALFHADNAYFYPSARLASLPLRANIASATAFRGFGGPQGMVGAERLIEEIAFALGRDPLDVRLANFYRPGRDETPYGQGIDDHVVVELVETLAARADYRARRAALHEANARADVILRGIALTPVKFGISFTLTAYNQAGALVHVYADGSVGLNHGGTEMGQGLHVKIAQTVAEEFQIDSERVRVTATTTGKVPNTSATAASSGADLNAMAARAAARTIRERLAQFAAERFQTTPERVVFAAGRVRAGGADIAFEELIAEAYLARISLSSTGFYRTPGIHWDREAGRGRPFHYYAYGAACAEVAVDALTGETRIERVDILHDAGRSLNPAIDRGQIEGGFVQGAGWLTSEELVWDAEGRLMTHAPSTYKIPACGDRPRIFNVELWERPNAADTIHRSKAVGEPPLMLAISVLHAISDAVASVAGHRHCPRLDAPATPERVLEAIERLRGRAP